MSGGNEQAAKCKWAFPGDSVKVDSIYISRHAFRRMFERGISPEQVRQAIETGECIEEYPDDTPFPSRLLFATVQNRPLHVVVGFDEMTRSGHIITVYVPDALQWSDDFRVRRKP